MTLSELYNEAKKQFEQADIESSQYDAMCLMEHCFGVDRPALAVMGSDCPPERAQETFLSDVKKRAGGYPLQYIIGKWTFMDIPFFVGEGVLIPRDDTEVLVRGTLERIKNIKNPKIIDLCSGSGAVAIAIAKARPDAEIKALELSSRAFDYLVKNIEANSVENVTPINSDVFTAYSDFDDGEFDAVVANPPYVCSAEIETLSSELQYEPRIALDGGDDGMIFYFSIAENWLSKIKKGGLVGLEISETQGKPVSTLLKDSNAKNIEVIKDIAELDRAVFGTME